MPIPEAQLDTWSKQGSVTQSKNTYLTIKNALEARDTGHADKNCESFLQGSYGNDTNAYADSDVDIVMKSNSTFYRDISRLSGPQQAAYKSSFSDASYTFPQFKKDVISALQKQFGPDVVPGKKAVWVKPNGGRRNADVLPAVQFRRYYEFLDMSHQRYDEGIAFLLPDKNVVENFPKQHSQNCSSKHQAANQWYKPTVRIFKNMRNHMINKGLLAEGIAPSYFLEGMLYNVSNENFGTSYADTFVACFNWIVNADRTKLVCASNLHWLVRAGEHTSWPPEHCSRFLDAARDLWAQW